MDSAETTERFWETTKTVYRVKERRVTIFSHSLHVEYTLSSEVKCGFLQVAIIDLEGDSVTQEIGCLTVKAELGEEFCTSHGIQRFIFPCGFFININTVHVLIEVAALLLL